MFRYPPDRPCPLTWFPDYSGTNPYQSLLYGALGPTFDPQPGTIEDALARPARGLFHLHWEHAVFATPGGSAEAFLDALLAFRARGGRIVWTLHNLEPRNEALAPAIADLRSGLVELADAIHLHSLPALAAARRVLALPPGKVRIIPHASYDGAYPVLHRGPAREALGLAEARMVLLLPGRLAAYKQPGALAAAFRSVAGPQDRLLLAGEAVPGTVPADPGDARILVLPGFAPPEVVSRCHAAADLVALPYDRSLTSGSAVLAATLGRGVIGPDLPGLRDVVEPPRTGLLYDPAEEEGLARAIATALGEGAEVWARRGEAARALAAARDLRFVAAAWRDLFGSLLATAEPPRVGAAP
ncbi:glycosyltransferase [Cereibacter sphaeroides]|uniref:glycosyltransferase n=1 Tax=Cereibacter sphaeroides TaxID=1063 RepID=UPI001F360432|nr:glycosyltransferase [Cereibacter sphaeroides]MCE6959801.1 glycosyltransferase [Cereibacter sphaeroides]MCE6974655.1 glycosyltransferase [Cereibacter sphaeroides]